MKSDLICSMRERGVKMNAMFDRDQLNPTQSPFYTTGVNQVGKKSLLARWIRLAEHLHQKHKNYFQRLPLEDHLLQDIGMSRMDVELDVEELQSKFKAAWKKGQSAKALPL